MHGFLLCVRTKVVQFDDFGADNASAHLAMLLPASWRVRNRLIPFRSTPRVVPSKLLLPLSLAYSVLGAIMCVKT